MRLSISLSDTLDCKDVCIDDVADGAVNEDDNADMDEAEDTDIDDG